MIFSAPQAARCLSLASGALCLLLCATTVLAQREYTVIKPPERSPYERVIIRTKAAQPSKGVLAVILDPIISGQVVVKDAAGRVLSTQKADQKGQAEFQLQRGRAYQVEVSHPGFLSASGKSNALKTNEIVRVNLIPRFAKFNLRGLPRGTQIFIDDKPRATVDQSGAVVLNEVEPGRHSLRISHPEYNDYTDHFEKLEAGDEVNYSRIPLTRVAKLSVQALAGATVLIDGAVQGRVRADGTVQIDYELERAAEHTISVDLLGHQTWSQKLLLAPGPRTITVRLEPIVTSAGVTDYFENLAQWNAPASWKITTAGKRLEVSGAQLGTLKDRTYRDFEANFLVWLGDGKGATWAVRADKEGRNYYLFHLAGPNATARTPGRFSTYLVTDGGAPQEVSTPIPLLLDLNTKTSYTINVRVTGHSVQHKITSNDTAEEVTLGLWTDTTATRDKFLYGTFGFRALADEVFTVDDFTLELSKEP
jgi:hypothetical protein